MHSTWSDGSQTLEDIVEAGIERGYRFCAVTDHSYGLKIAGGVSMAELAEQHARSIALNKKYRGRFRLLKGIEANIRADGIDRHGAARAGAARDRRRGAALGAAVARRSDRADGQRGVDARASTSSAIRAGGCIGSRPGVSADWDRVFEAAQRSPDVAIEIDGDPSRQDLDYDLARRAVGAGCLFALDSDAHSTGELRATRKPRSRTRASPASPPIASSTAGRWSGCSSGRDHGPAEPEEPHYGCTAPISRQAFRPAGHSHSDRPVISR